MTASYLREDLARRIDQSFSIFEKLVSKSEGCVESGQFELAAAYAEIAAYHCYVSQTGVLASGRIEKVLTRIGQTLSEGPSKRTRVDGPPRRVLHVLTRASGIGGDTRFVWRWIERDSGRQHSVAITRQRQKELPEQLVRAVASVGGDIVTLDSQVTATLERARLLREFSKSFDLVVLHLFPDDVVPAIALSIREDYPPVAYVTHADQLFLVGVYVADFVVHLRESGLSLSSRRRLVDSQRGMILPIPVDENWMDRRKREEARKEIGVDPDKVLLLTVARAPKYNPFDGPSLPEVMVPIVNKHRKCVLLAIGPENSGPWKRASLESEGRILALGPRLDTSVFYDSADIYLDSFPFASNTSLLEAGLRGIPLVSYFPFSETSSVLGPGAPGLDGTVTLATDLGEYAESLGRLISDLEYRTRLGRETRERIIATHCGEAWLDRLKDLYHRAGSIRRGSSPELWKQDTRAVEELDVLSEAMTEAFNPDERKLGGRIDQCACSLPYLSRLKLLRIMLSIDRSFSFSLFLPEWIGKRIQGRLSSVRRFPPFKRWFEGG